MHALKMSAALALALGAQGAWAAGDIGFWGIGDEREVANLLAYLRTLK